MILLRNWKTGMASRNIKKKENFPIGVCAILKKKKRNDKFKLRVFIFENNVNYEFNNVNVQESIDHENDSSNNESAYAEEGKLQYYETEERLRCVYDGEILSENGGDVETKFDKGFIKNEYNEEESEDGSEKSDEDCHL